MHACTTLRGRGTQTTVFIPLACTGLQLHFMAQSWIVSLYLDCPPGIPGLMCPTAAARANFTDAVRRGYITWHAFPHNGELELADAGLISVRRRIS